MEKENKIHEDHKHDEKCHDCGEGNLCCDSKESYPAIITVRGFTCDNCGQSNREIRIVEKKKQEK